MPVDNLIPLLYSPTPNTKPPVNTRLTGELWTNFPDLQLGLIDATQASVPLIAVRYFSPNTAYVGGDFVIQAGHLYIAKSAVPIGPFNAAQWTAMQTAADVAAAYLPLAGGTLTGPLTLSGNATQALHAVPLQQVATLAMGDNRIINGDMRIDQRFGGTAGTRAPNTYVLDRWFYYATQTGKTNMGINNGNPWSFITNSTSAYASLATDYFQIAQKIEADQISDCFFGTVNARPITLSFQAFSTQGGLFSGSIRNDLGTRSYPFTYTLPASAWTNISVTIPGDTSGAWNLLGNGIGLLVGFDLGSGANFRGAAGVWASSNYTGATGAVSLVGTNGANFYLTNVKLEIGSIATPFNRQSLAKSMADCQRYYQQLNGPATLVSGYNSAGGSIYCPFMLPVVMRASPTVVLGTSTSSNASSIITQSADATAVLLGATITATGSGYARSALTLSAEL